MSKESMEWLNTQTLIGFTNQRGNAWHYAESLQGNEPNHYAEAIPVEDVIRRLFSFNVVETPLYVRGRGGFMEVPNRKAMVTDDDETVLGVFKGGYAGHGYREWLLDNVSRILGGTNGDTLGIGSAGLLRNRAQAWVQVERPENIEAIPGFSIRPNILACTSFDGSLATTYAGTVGVVVCDNTLAAAVSEDDAKFKVKHSRYSGMRIKDARDALGILVRMADDATTTIRTLSETTVSAKQFADTLTILVPITDSSGKPLEGRGKTLAENKRDAITSLYGHDDRVSPWAGSALGVVQAFNTYAHHLSTIRGEASRVQRNKEYALSGKIDALDTLTLDTLAKVGVFA
jgi:phage/plasmid-like protein (TIGR03299 family)